MKTLLALFTCLLLLAYARAADDGFLPILNGKDLTGWDGNPALWSVEDGCISGKTSGPGALEYNQFLIWRGGVLNNFELHAKIKESGNNTGIQYRSKELPEIGKWSIGGYQLDIHPAPSHNGSMYEEKGRGVIATNGESVVVDPEGKRWVVAKREPVKVEVAEWHDYAVIAQGNHLIQKIDGQVTMDLVDHEEKARALQGLLAFQIHKGPAMNVQIKDVMLKELPAGGVTAFDKSALPADAKGNEPKAPGAKGKKKGKAPEPQPQPAPKANS